MQRPDIKAHANLETALAGESMAHTKYRYSAVGRAARRRCRKLAYIERGRRRENGLYRCRLVYGRIRADRKLCRRTRWDEQVGRSAPACQGGPGL